MVSSLSIFFLVAIYVYFKQHYEKLIAAKAENNEEKAIWGKKLKRKLMILPAGVIAVVVLYIISFTFMAMYPDVENVKASRRVVDAVATLLFVGLFFMDKRELDKKFIIKKEPEPEIEIPE